jgi:hypothetical protein
MDKLSVCEKFLEFNEFSNHFINHHETPKKANSEEFKKEV